MDLIINTEIEKYNKKLKKEFQVLEKLKSGKEAEVYKIYDLEGNIFALKIYKEQKYRSFQDNALYLHGRYFREKSVRRAVGKKTTRGKSIVQNIWVSREYFMLKKLNELTANVPKVFSAMENSILMEFIGDDKPAPRLKDTTLTAEDKREHFEIVIYNMKLFLDFGIVHGDLSEFNILVFKNKVYIIDFPQSIDIQRNANWEIMLRRDVVNVCSFFQKDPEVILRNVFKLVP